MIEGVIQLLIYVCVICLVVYLVLWVLESVAGISLPPKVVQIIWIIVVLVVLLLLLRLILPGMGIKIGMAVANAGVRSMMRVVMFSVCDGTRPGVSCPPGRFLYGLRQ